MLPKISGCSKNKQTPKGGDSCWLVAAPIFLLLWKTPIIASQARCSRFLYSAFQCACLYTLFVTHNVVCNYCTLLSFPIFRFSVCKSAVNILYMQVSTVNKLHMHMICTLINFFSIFHSRKCASLIHIEHYTLNVHLYCTMLPFTIFHSSWIPLNIHILSLARWPPFVVDKIRLTNLQRTGGRRYHKELYHIIFISS